MRQSGSFSSIIIVNTLVIAIGIYSPYTFAQGTKQEPSVRDLIEKKVRDGKFENFLDQSREQSIRFIEEFQKEHPDVRTFADRDRKQTVDLTQPKVEVKSGMDRFSTFPVEVEGAEKPLDLGMWMRFVRVNETGMMVSVRICNAAFDCNESKKGGPIASTSFNVSYEQSPNDNSREIKRRMRDLNRGIDSHLESLFPKKPKSMVDRLIGFIFGNSAYAQGTWDQLDAPLRPGSKKKTSGSRYRSNKMMEDELGSVIAHLIVTVMIGVSIFSIFTIGALPIWKKKAGLRNFILGFGGAVGGITALFIFLNLREDWYDERKFK